MKAILNVIRFGVLASMLSAAVLHAQTTPGSAPDTTSRSGYDSQDRRGKEHNFGWLGLLGLAGLAGLMRPKRDIRDTRDTSVR